MISRVLSNRTKSSARLRWYVVALCLMLASIANGNAEDWPTYQHDNQRSGITPESLKLPLNEVWRYDAPNAPRPAWPDPAKYDFAKSNDDPLRPREVYDRAFHTVVADGMLYLDGSDKSPGGFGVVFIWPALQSGGSRKQDSA